jgi:phosphatidylserine decarboxylase
LDFIIKTDVKFAKIINSKFNIPVECKLLKRGDKSYLIYANIKKDESNEWDLFDTLNTAFDLDPKLPKNTLLVNKAGFFQYSGDMDKLSMLFPNSPIPTTVEKQSTFENESICKNESIKSSEAVCFWFSFSIQTSDLFSKIIEIGDENNQAGSELSLFGVLESGVENKKAIKECFFQVNLPDIRLVQLFDFKNLILQYQFDNQKRFRITGDLTVSLFGHDYSFHGLVDSNSTRFITAMSSVGDLSIDSPFSAMPGIVFKDLVFNANYTYKQTSPEKKAKSLFQVSVSTEIASLAFHGQILLNGSTPVMALVELDNSFTISKLVDQCVHDHIWRDEIVDITFLSGSCLYYQKESVTPKDIEFLFPGTGEIIPKAELSSLPYDSGFNIYTKFILTLITDIYLEGNVSITKDGVTGEICKPGNIDLWIVSLVGAKQADGSVASGPVLKFDSKQKSMEFICGLEFFKSDFGLNTSIKVIKDEGKQVKIEGKLKADRVIEPFFSKPPKLCFSYDKTNGFKITNWKEFTLEGNYIDFLKEIQKIVSRPTDVCEKIVEKVINKVLKNKFLISPSFSTSNDQLSLQLHCRYSLYFLGQECFPPLKISEPITLPIETDWSFDELHTQIGKWIKKSAQAFIDAVLASDKSIEKILLIMAGKELATKFAAALVCRNKISKSVLDSLKSSGNPKYKDPKEPKDPKDPKDSTDTDTSPNYGVDAIVAGTVAGAVAAGGAAGSWFFVLVGVVVVLVLVIAINDTDDGTAAPEKGGVAEEKYLSSGFMEGTMVELADGSKTAIENIKVGNKLCVHDKEIKTVVSIKKTTLGKKCKLYYINNNREWCVTQEHLFCTKDGLKSIAPTASLSEDHNLNIGTLQIGDQLLTTNKGYWVEVSHIGVLEARPQTALFNFKLSDGHSYFHLGVVKDIQYQREGLHIKFTWKTVDHAQKYQVVCIVPNKLSGEHELIDVGNVLEWSLPLPETGVNGEYKFIIRACSDETLVINGVWSEALKLSLALSVTELIAEYKTLSYKNDKIAKLVMENLPSTMPLDLVQAMHDNEYDFEDAGQVLQSAFPNITATDVAKWLTDVYGKNDKSLNYQLTQAYKNKKTATEAGQLAQGVYPSINANQLAVSLANVGYLYQDVGQALKNLYPKISASYLTSALTSAYGKDDSTPESIEQFNHNKTSKETTMDQEYTQPYTIDEFKAQIQDWYDRNDQGFQDQFHKAIENVQSRPEDTDDSLWHDWTEATIDDLCNFFEEWYYWTPDVSTGLEYIQKFSWINYENEEGLKFVTTGLGYLMTKHFVVLNGKWMDSPESISLVEKWMGELGDKMNDYVIPDDGYKSFNEFFTRKLINDRPISGEDDDSVVVSPADAIVNMIDDNLSIDNTDLPVKTQRLNVRELLNNSGYAEHFEGGTAVSCILMPDVYHHYHAPVSGWVVESDEDVAGKYFGIDEFPKLINGGNVGYGYDYSVFEHFRRGYLIIDTEKYGYVAMIPVGLNTIASVIFRDQFKKVTADDEPVAIQKGDEIGYFQYGGSMNILLFEKGCFPSIRIPQGQIIGTLKEKETTDQNLFF